MEYKGARSLIELRWFVKDELGEKLIIESEEPKIMW